jgi:Flp pilus assembly protein CpaB
MRARRRIIVRRRLLPRRLRHHPVARGLVALVVIVVAASFLQRVTARAGDAQRRWGATHTVFVARHRIAIGSAIDADAVERHSWPLAVIPSGAVDTDPVGRTVVATIEAGEAILTERLAPDGLAGVAALVPSGWRALAILVALTVGDHVDLIAGFDVDRTNGNQSPSFVVARDAVVVSTDEQRVTVAVRADDVERVAFAVVAGTVVPALRST